MEKIKKRCGIYTRKSHEEGLEQEFNSLDAQRMSAENYIASQEHEGWECLPVQYNDGGFTGGNLERPALQRLFQDIRDGKIDCIIVYKIDRLTRSLLDFSKIIELLDEHNCSFVAVTQSFNTSNSMGRLMLNVLLSFAQYERELTSERIRDKFEASCKLGIWMGGNPPLGYNPKDRKLLINESEAKLVRIIYQRFLEVASPTEVARDMNEMGFKTKTWISESGKLHKGSNFTKRSIRHILDNPVYAGKISHKGNIYDGEHEPIIMPDMWNKAQSIFKRKNDKVTKPTSRISKPPLLKGIFSCGFCGTVMTPTYTNKKGKRYRYYVCSAKQRGVNEKCPVGTISASEAEQVVIDQVLQLLSSPEITARTLAATSGELPDTQVISGLQNIDKVWGELFPSEQSRIIHLLIRGVIITPKGIDITIHSDGINLLKQELEAA
ncbi:MAG: recombinase family protein [Proteobacteria bacterium]|nr:recombinase family protein [Pseudomonadota bacterium]